MIVNFESLIDELKSKKIRLSHQRLKVLEYLTTNYNHPTADQIYNGLHDEVPTLSKTTVYNTLNSLIDANLVRAINIEDNEVRYDINTHDHGHFKCESCKNIYDFNINIDSFETDQLYGFEINDKNVFFKGTCKSCIINGKK
ncbi:Fur family transcriptional regulator [Sedimentibacter sp.]|uniref:Fur family transcriptional regulator n=1 Tax=Sedimentibacter sp. TaxID=1960295 RepID=UPI0028AFF5A6|nr:Fur family transcriptional regulator [Sedimentibacter sp.]